MVQLTGGWLLAVPASLMPRGREFGLFLLRHPVVLVRNILDCELVGLRYSGRYVPETFGHIAEKLSFFPIFFLHDDVPLDLTLPVESACS
jgi:hypothetical protein